MFPLSGGRQVQGGERSPNAAALTSGGSSIVKRTSDVLMLWSNLAKTKAIVDISPAGEFWLFPRFLADSDGFFSRFGKIVCLRPAPPSPPLRRASWCQPSGVRPCKGWHAVPPLAPGEPLFGFTRASVGYHSFVREGCSLTVACVPTCS